MFELPEMRSRSEVMLPLFGREWCLGESGADGHFVTLALPFTSLGYSSRLSFCFFFAGKSWHERLRAPGPLPGIQVRFLLSERQEPP